MLDTLQHISQPSEVPFPTIYDGFPKRHLNPSLPLGVKAFKPVTLTDKQTELVTAIRRSFAQGHRMPCVQAATGFGKSVVTGYIIKNALDKGAKRVVVVVDSLTLIDQLINTFETMFGLSVGVIQGYNAYFDLDKSVQIATPQTLARRFEDERYGHRYRNYLVDLIIVDECHLQYQGTRDAMRYWKCKGMGFTATPYAKGLGLTYDDLVKAPPMEQLIADGDLAKYRAFSHASPDFTGCKVGNNGDIQDVDDLYSDGLIGDVFETWNRSWRDRLSIGFASSIGKCEAFAQLFRSKGVNSIAIHSKLSTDDAKSIVEQFKQGNIRVLWSVAKLIKGFDVPEASCLIDCQPTYSLMRHIQKGGRVLRKHPDKEYAVILDHAGNMQRNGLYEEASIDELSTAKKGEKNADRKQEADSLIICPHCSNMIKPTHECPHCGHEFGQVSIRQKADDIGWKDGELIEITKQQRNKKTPKADKIAFMGGLKWLGSRRGYAKGWANNMYRARFGVWPNDKPIKNAKEVVPNIEVVEFVKAAKRGTA